MKPNEISDSDVRITDISVRSALMRVRWNDMPVRRIDISVRSPDRSVRYIDRSVRCSDSAVRCSDNAVRCVDSTVRCLDNCVDATPEFDSSTAGIGGTGCSTVRSGRPGNWGCSAWLGMSLRPFRVVTKSVSDRRAVPPRGCAAAT